MAIRTSKATAPKFKQNEAANSKYATFGETASVDEKLRILKELGQPELIEIFKEWKPRPSRRRRSAPLDQRVAISITNSEKVSLDGEIRAIKKTGDKITTSQFIRNRALGTVDINGWRDIAIAALSDLTEWESNQSEMRKRKKMLAALIEETDDEEDIGVYEREIADLNRKLNKLIAKNERRSTKLTGRMSMAEAETVRWRAQRLCISASDYLRFMIFNLSPNSAADAHMSLDSKRRFYVSIIDVANQGWGDPPTIYNCTQCGNYVEEIERLRDRVKQLENFS